VRTTRAFQDLLRRDPTSGELSNFAKADRLKLLATIAAKTEFQTTG
jgi:hypothetical protein